MEDELCAGDFMMVVKNNYFWLDDASKAGFIANGDIVEILKIRGYETLYGFRFANVTVRMIDYPNEPDLEVKLLMDSILTDAPSLTGEKFKEIVEKFPNKSNKELLDYFNKNNFVNRSGDPLSLGAIKTQKSKFFDI